MARRRAVAVAAPWRFPVERVFKLLWSLVILVSVLLAVLAGVGGFLTYRVVTVRNDTENVTPASYLLSSYETVDFTDRQGGVHEGWLLLGLKGAPVVVLCHGYNSNRSELLSLGTVLRENHFNVYLYNQQGAKALMSYSNLGVRQAYDLLDAIDFITKHPAVNAHRVGVFGTTTGGYAALVAAERNPMIEVLVVDTIYDDPDQMFYAQLDRLLGGSGSIFRFLTRLEFHIATLRTERLRVRQNLTSLGKIPKLFISGRDTPILADATESLYNQAPQPKRLLVLEHSQSALASGTEKTEYEFQTLTFFLQNLPLRAD
jgi:esterase/lipase